MDNINTPDNNPNIPPLPPIQEPIQHTNAQPASPVTSNQRIVFIDQLRGFALLGILLMNIQAFAYMSAAYSNPAVYGLEGSNLWSYMFTHIFAEMKMMNLFSMLFGAGMLLFLERAEKKTNDVSGLHYRRMIWLMCFGLAHAYLIWWGDILFMYSVSGMIIYLFRKMSPKWLLISGILFAGVTSLIFYLFSLGMSYYPEDALQSMQDSWLPSAETIAAEENAYKGNYIEQFEKRVPFAFVLQIGGIIMYIWRIVGNMLIGMALFKWGIMKGEKTTSFYWALLAGCFAVGFSLIGLGLYQNLEHDFSFDYSQFTGIQFNYWGSLFISVGYLSLIALWSKSNFLNGLKARLAAVGRMAFTNYIMHSVLCSFIFYGIGLGLMGEVNRPTQLLIVVGIWILQLIISPIWLKNYRFGPLEWLWRSLTYQMKPKNRIES